MKHVLLMMVVLLGISVSVNAQTSSIKMKKEKHKVALKEHVCTDACHTAGHCMYAHGEKGHECTEECKKMDMKKMDMKKMKTDGMEMKKMGLKDHVCTDACHNAGHCVFAHGEKGHECGDECKKKI